MFLPSFELPKDTTRVWDLIVPIVTIDNETHAYITDEIGSPSDYNELCYLLRVAPKGHIFHLHINTPGGVIDSALQLTSAMKSSKAQIIGHLSGTVASAGTMITMACTDIEVSPHVSFMIHNYSGGLMGKGGELKARQAHDEKTLRVIFEDFYTGFLTDREIKDVIADKDMWLGTDEVTSRWARKHAVDTFAPTTTATSTTKRGRPRKAE